MVNHEEIPIEELLAALRDETSPIPPKYLYHLSDLSGDNLSAVADVWANASATRRRNLVEDLESLEESYTLASFIELYKLAIADSDPQVRITGLRAIWDYEEPELIPAVLASFESDPEDSVKAQAATALGRYIYRYELGELPQKTGETLVKALLAAMASDCAESIRLRALESLGFCSRESIADHIQEAYQYGDDRWVTSALIAMGRSLDERWQTSIIEKLDDDQQEIRLEAVRAAGLHSLEEAVPALVDLLENEDEDLRYAAIWSLSEIGGDEAREALEELMALVEDDEEDEFLENAMDNLFLNDEIKELSLMDFSEEDLEDLKELPEDSEEE